MVEGACSDGERALAHLALSLAWSEPDGQPPTEAGPRGPPPPSPTLAIFDEFGSAWDESTAARVARSLSAALRTAGWLECAGVVLASCHICVIGADALQPDWVFEAASATCLWLEPRPVALARHGEEPQHCVPGRGALPQGGEHQPYM